ncbi:MAG: RIP metalloprotease RseP [Verrucomicrobiales bacterium]|nr:RIP metalloprotease RseP [Verrucomicrobiales bacterium]
MSQFLNVLYIVAGVVFLFGAAVFVHEFGHFWMARRRGMKVEAFAIGFGPKIFSWVKDGIEYSFRWIPAGGYVKLPQMITSEALEGKSDSSIPPASPFSKILVAVAGPFMNVVFAFVIATVIYVVGLPVPMNPSIIGLLAPSSQEYQMGIRSGDRIVAVDGTPVKTWQEIFEVTVFARTNVVAVEIEREGERKTYHLTANADNAVGLKMLNLDSKDHVLVGHVEKGSPAAEVGIKSGDEIVSFAGVPIVSREQLSDAIHKRGEQESEIALVRKDQRLSFKVTPRMDPALNRARIGIAFATKYVLQKPGPLPWQQVRDVWNKTISTLSALFHSKQTGVGVKDLSGPPGILAMLAAQLNTDYRLALSFLVLLNINLAIINLFPMPVLDGGHILMAIVEKVRGRALSVRTLEYTTTAFAVLLISFMLYVSFNDVTKRFGIFKSMFQGETKIEQPENNPAEPPNLKPAPLPSK